MRQSILAFLIILPASLFAAPPRREGLPADVSTVVHVDLEQLQTGSFGPQLLAKAAELPRVKELFKTIPESLSFLTQTEVKDVTVLTWSKAQLEGNTDEPVLLARLSIDEEKLVGLLRLGRDYAQISHRGVAVHHWRPNVEAIRETLLGPRKKSPKKKDASQVSYLAFPEPGALVVTQSLPLMLKTLDRHRGQNDAMSKARYKAWVGDRPSWLCVMYDHSGDFPSNIIARLWQESDGRVTLTAETTCRNETEKAIGAGLLGILNNAEQLGRAATQAIVAGKKTGDADSQEESASDSDNQHGSFSFGIMLDGKGGSDSDIEDVDKFASEIGALLSKVVKPTFKNGRLKVTASAYPGSWDVKFESENNRDDISVHLQLFSSKAKHLASKNQNATRR